MMAKLGLGTIGTSWITDSFIEAALESKQYTLNCVYSRGAEKAKEFAEKYGDIAIETDLDAFMNNEHLDVIYIASPNSLHYEQTLLALKAGKHVVVEKPASTNPDQWDEMLEVAQANDVFVFEAARHMHIPNFKKIQETLNDFGDIQGATFAYAKYSSRYDAVLAGEEPNIFSLDFAGGVLMDLGIYPVYTAVALFGKPKTAKYFPRKMKTGVDGSGTILLRYETFDVTLLISKTTTSLIGMEIYGETDTLVVDHATDMTKATRIDAKSLEAKEISLRAQHENTMYYEAEKFAEMIANKQDETTLKQYQELSELAGIVSGILYDLRMQNDLQFTFEK
jgi:predicted dehydrogenase